MKNTNIQNIVILGGGSSGWMTAATLARFLKNEYASITLVESEEIGIVGVGEATIPQMKVFNDTLGINEDDFVKKTQATFKLGIEFVDWGALGDRYIHAFGDVGKNMQALPFYHFWLKMHQKGKAAALSQYTLNARAARENKFMRSVNAGNSPLSHIAYAYHLDATLYARYLREYAEALGVKRIEGKVSQAHVRDTNGFIEALQLENGEKIAGDLFIDCSGFRALLIEDTLKTGYEDWSDQLLCDSAIAVPCENAGKLTPYTRSTAHSAGWQWRIPLQHRMGNGHVYSSRYMSDDEATSLLMNNLDGEPLADPRVIKFKTGKRKKVWNKNCIAIGLSSGFIEPLESTALYLVQAALAKLMIFFPNKSFGQLEIDEFNRHMDFEYEKIRDFIVLHYKATTRSDSPFWDRCRTMDVSPALQNKIELYKSSGRVLREGQELFNETSWLEVMHGQGIVAESYHPLVDAMSEHDITERLNSVETVIKNAVDYMPDHADYIQKNCRA